MPMAGCHKSRGKYIVTGGLSMSGTMFMRVSEVAEELGVSESYAYKLIQKLNKELKATGCLTLPGRIDRKFFHDHIYATRTNSEKE